MRGEREKERKERGRGECKMKAADVIERIHTSIISTHQVTCTYHRYNTRNTLRVQCGRFESCLRYLSSLRK